MPKMYLHLVDGVVDLGPGPLPQNWRNVAGLDGLSDEELAPLGWYPCPGEAPAYDPAWQTISGPVAVLDEGVWRLEWTVTERVRGEVQAERLAAVRAEAGRRILDFAPMYRQMNAARDLLREDDAAAEAAVALFDRIDAYRAASDVAEAAILAATTAEEAASVTAGWPE
jgi:hypothetical protein